MADDLLDKGSTDPAFHLTHDLPLIQERGEDVDLPSEIMDIVTSVGEHPCSVF
jgi:hypothetical protein